VRAVVVVQRRLGGRRGGGGGGGGGGRDPRKVLNGAKDAVAFLQEPDSKILEFWLIWADSIPPVEELGDDTINCSVAVSADLEKLTWRTAGPQSLFIQRMVDFFWNVGAPESEIDRLNDVGANINPVRIGSWIDMSKAGGMDGGWYFPVPIPLNLCVEAADAGDAVTQLSEWANSHNVSTCISVGRDMGAAPPRQTDFRIELAPDASAAEQARLALDAFDAFGFPPMPDYARAALERSTVAGITMSVITSADGFVRIGVLQPAPSDADVRSLCASSPNANYDGLRAFGNAIGQDTPMFIEYQYLETGFGYGVYQEGFSITLHYDL